MEFEEVRAKLLGYPPGATVPLSHEEITVLKWSCPPQIAWDAFHGEAYGRHFGLEAVPGSKLTWDAVVAAAREIRGLRVGDHFRVRCPIVFENWNKPIEPGKIDMITETCESFELTPKLAAQVWPGWKPENPYRTHWPA